MEGNGGGGSPHFLFLGGGTNIMFRFHVTSYNLFGGVSLNHGWAIGGCIKPPLVGFWMIHSWAFQAFSHQDVPSSLNQSKLFTFFKALCMLFQAFLASTNWYPVLGTLNFGPKNTWNQQQPHPTLSDCDKHGQHAFRGVTWISPDSTTTKRCTK